MTLILTAGNDQQCILIADRRLIYDGEFKEGEDENNKVGSVFCDDCRLAYAFTGLAKYGRFDTNEWLLSEIKKCPKSERSFIQIGEYLKNKLNEIFSENKMLSRLDGDTKKLSIVFVGYCFSDNPPTIVRGLISNFESYLKFHKNQNDFIFTAGKESRPNSGSPFMVNIFGTRNAVRKEELEKMCEMVIDRIPESGIIGKASEIMRAAADREIANNYIGRQLNCIVIPMENEKPVSETYLTDIKTKVSYGSPYIYVTSKGDMEVSQTMMFSAREGEEIDFSKFKGDFDAIDQTQLQDIAFPRVKPKEPCPCKSGKKYKYCHGRPISS